ncbi:hypothetical protein [Desertimonas flava]|uniref:hypothetical protein n=1 Tax=Desertimonas flava TaxID=2064846 RepID=UPI0023F2C765|nr:hypothetical protein [Desertimonas flava]
MTRSPRRNRLVIGASVAAAAFGTLLVAHSASASTPPSDPPSSDASPPTGGADYDALVDTIVSTSAESGIPMNRDCVAGIVEQVPADDVAAILAEVEASATVADMPMPDISMPDLGEISIPELPDISMPDLGDISIPELPDISMPDLGDISIPSVPAISIPPIGDMGLSPETLALSQQLVTCVDGDADPALVEQVVALAESSTPPGVLDLECASKMLSTFPDEVLQQIVDTGAVQADPTAVDPTIAAEVAKLLACTDLSTITGTADAPAPSVAADAAPVTTVG